MKMINLLMLLAVTSLINLQAMTYKYQTESELALTEIKSNINKQIVNDPVVILMDPNRKCTVFMVCRLENNKINVHGFTEDEVSKLKDLSINHKEEYECLVNKAKTVDTNELVAMINSTSQQIATSKRVVNRTEL